MVWDAEPEDEPVVYFLIPKNAVIIPKTAVEPTRLPLFDIRLKIPLKHVATLSNAPVRWFRLIGYGVIGLDGRIRHNGQLLGDDVHSSELVPGHSYEWEPSEELEQDRKGRDVSSCTGFQTHSAVSSKIICTSSTSPT